MSDGLLIESLLLVAGSAAAVALCLRLGLSPVVGYLAAGLIIGPSGAGLLQPSEGTRFLAELGVALLMFLVGLEFSLPRMLAARAVVFGLGGLQVTLTAACGAALALALGADWLGALLIGGAVAMSSTAVSLKTLADLGELGSQHGRLAVGVLLFQDLAALPFLATIGALMGRPDAGLAQVLGQLLVATLAFLAVAFLARPALTGLMAWVARTRSSELFLLAVLALVLATAFVAEKLGLSLALGAFFAGMIIGESEFRHQVEADIRPFRDVLLGVFFVTVGMQIMPAAALERPILALGALAFFLLVKPVLALIAARLMGREPEPALRAAVVLAHGGEFGLLILTLALGAGLVPAGLAQPLLGALAVSFALAPVMIQFNGPLVGRLMPRRMAEAAAGRLAAVEEAGRELGDHVILAGCGRVGRLVASLLEAAEVPYLAIEADYERLRRARHEGLNAVFGDASAARILEAAGLERARLVVVTFDLPGALHRLLHHVRTERPELPVIVSVSDEQRMEAAAEAGASAVLPENLAAGLAVGAEALVELGFSHDEVAERIGELRLALHPELAGAEEGEEIVGEAVEDALEEAGRQTRAARPPGAPGAAPRPGDAEK